MRPCRRRRDEDGAVAVIAAVTLTVMMLLAALVVDLGFLRADRTASQSAADMAAAGAAFDYRPGTPGSARQACLEALDLAVDNLRVDASAVTAVGGASCAAEYPDTFDASCPTVSGRAVYRVDPYRIEIIAPVADGDPLMGTQGIVSDIDGQPCQRVGVSITRDRQLFFGGFAGVTDSATNRGAVARSFVGSFSDEYASLVVLDLEGCRSLRTASSGTKIRVLDLVDGTDTYPGNITVDAQQDCSGGNKVVSLNSASLIHASGELIAHSLASNDTGNVRTYDAGAVASGNLTQPVPGPRQTRRTVDHFINCKTGGYTNGTNQSPYRFEGLTDTEVGELVPPCEPDPPASGRAYVDELRAEYASRTAANVTGLPGWGVHDTCNAGGTFTPADFGGATRLFIDCNQYGPNADVAFQGFEAIVLPEGIDTGNGDLRITGPAATGTVVYVQERGLNIKRTTLLRHVFIYIDAPTGSTNHSNPGETLRISGSTDTFGLQAPLRRENCSSGRPNAACFAPVGLWSNGSAEHGFLGNTSGGVIGSMFTPNAEFKLRGGSNDSTDPCTQPASWDPLWAQIEAAVSGGLNLDAAQFFAERIEAAGNSTVRMCPNPETNIPQPLRDRNLIR